MNNYIYELRNVDLSFRNIQRINLLYRVGLNQKTIRPKTFKALNGISFSIERGHTVGLIGKNGSGKTTLLRVLAGIYSPDSGTIITNSKAVSLLALGVGFDSNASGFDNIYLSSMLNGHTQKEVDAKLDQIIKFADIGEFINGPVKTYSSGMRLRLAFSIAIHFEPDVLLIDEALSVGDAEFQRKSTQKMKELIEDRNRTVVIASHQMSFLKSVCDQVIWLQKGTIRDMGEKNQVIDAYITDASAKTVC